MEMSGTNNFYPETAGKPIICKAAVCRNAGEALVIEDIQVAPPKAWEVRIKILCTSLCHTDLSFWKFDSGPLALFPKIFGHEAVGVVESVGEHVTEVKEGDMVLPVARPNCGECRDCKSPKSNMCTKFMNKYHNGMPRDTMGRFNDMNGQAIHHFLSVSSFTEYTVVDVVHVVKISPKMPIDKACLLSCGVSTGLGAVWKVAQVEEGSTVAIFGLGTIGLAVAEASRLQGASRIIGVDLNPGKEDLGKKFGVTDFINPTKCGEKKTSQIIKELTDEGADYCFECIGSASIMQDAFESSREKCGGAQLMLLPSFFPGDKLQLSPRTCSSSFPHPLSLYNGMGKTIILGVEVPGTLLSLNCWDVIRGRSMMGSLFGGIKPKPDIPAFAQKYLDKELCLDGFISHEVGFHDINKAYEYLLQGKSLRCIIWMDK